MQIQREWMKLKHVYRKKKRNQVQSERPNTGMHEKTASQVPI